MEVTLQFYAFWFCLSVLSMKSFALEHVKIWLPTSDIFNRSNWVDPNSNENCRQVEFGEINTADINIDVQITAEDYELPVEGTLSLSNTASLKIVDHNSKLKTNCLKLKEIDPYYYTDPRNWDSDVANNPAVPDREKLPCRDDTIVLTPNFREFADFTKIHHVSKVKFDGFIIRNFFSNGVNIFERECHNPAGCVCNDEIELHCGELKEPECLSPIHPEGFCNPVCGAFITFKPMPGFSLKKVQEALKDYSDVYTHVSKVDDDVVQVIFAEKKYTGDSVGYAEKFYEKLQQKAGEFKITDLKNLKTSGSRTTGGASFFSVLLSSVVFVIGIFAFIFCVYGDRRWLTNLRFRNPATYPLTSTYRARFSSREDESGLIFDTQSMAGSVLNLRQSFDNPMFHGVAAAEDKANEEKIDTTEVTSSIPVEKQNDPLYDLKKLNEELQEEIGAEVVENLQTPLVFKSALVSDYAPLIEVDEINED